MKKPSPPCTQCKHHYYDQKGEMLCKRSGVRIKTDHSTGSDSLDYTLCQYTYSERNTRWLPWVCGPAGRYFTPIEVTTDA